MPFAPMSGGLPYRLLLGLRAPESPGQWLDAISDDDAVVYDQLEQRKEHLRERRHAVLQLLNEPAAHAAAWELLHQLMAELPAHHPHRYQVQGPVVHNLLTGDVFDTSAPGTDPLEVAGQLVQEDLVLLTRGGSDSHYRVLGGVVCFPAHWSVLEKLGQQLPDVHDPVPRWRADAARPALNFLSRLSPDSPPLIRWNWTLMPTPELHLSNFYDAPPGPHTAPPDDVSGIGHLHLRLERQFFHRLPQSQCVVFTIRTYQRPLRQAVAGRPVMAGALAGALRDLPYEHLQYKVNLQHRMPALLELLDGVAAAAGGAPGDLDGCGGGGGGGGGETPAAAAQQEAGESGPAVMAVAGT